MLLIDEPDIRTARSAKPPERVGSVGSGPRLASNRHSQSYRRPQVPAATMDTVVMATVTMVTATGAMARVAMDTGAVAEEFVEDGHPAFNAGLRPTVR